MLLLALDLLDALTRGGEVFRHCAAKLLYGVSDSQAYIIVHLIGFVLASDIFPANLLVSLCRTEKVGRQLRTAHEIEEFPRVRP